MERLLSAALNSAEIAAKHGLKLMDISNRRYLGSKQKLLAPIATAISDELGRLPLSLADSFAGSGVVSAYFADRGVPVVANDLLKHNALVLETFLLHGRYRFDALCEVVNELHALKGKTGYVTETFGGKYFSFQNAEKLDAMRDFLEEQISDLPLRNAALTCILYAADKVAQTVGHYDAYFNRESNNKALNLRVPNIVGTGDGHAVHNLDANDFVRVIEAEVNFQDPPYNSRQYSSNYHVLENIANWKKPAVTGVSAKMNLKSLSSKYSTRGAVKAYEDLVLNCQASVLALTYSNTASERVSRSNNFLSDDEIYRILGNFGPVKKIEIGHKEFSVGKTSTREHRERIFLTRRSS